MAILNGLMPMQDGPGQLSALERQSVRDLARSRGGGHDARHAIGGAHASAARSGATQSRREREAGTVQATTH